MKRTLRVTLLTVLLGLTLLTVVTLSVSSYLHTRDTAQDLSRQILDQTSERIDQQVGDLTQIARRQVSLNEHLFQTGFLGHEAETRLGEFWVQVLGSYPRLNSLYFTRDDDGSTLQALRDPRLGTTLRTIRPRRGGFELTDRRPEDHRFRDRLSPRTAAAMLAGMGSGSAAPLSIAASLPTHWTLPTVHADKHDFDQRTKEWYRIPWTSDRAEWIDTSLLSDDLGEPSNMGVTYAVPVRDGRGRRVGVVGLDFNVGTLCNFLRGLKVSEHGVSFVIEQRKDGSRRLVGHPDPAMLADEKPTTEGRGTSELKPLSELSDSRVRELLTHLPDTFDPRREKGLNRVRFRIDGTAQLGVYRGLEEEAGDSPNWIICIVLPEDDVLARTKANMRDSTIVGLIVLAIAVLLSLYVSRQVAHPVERVAHEVVRVGGLDLDARTQPASFIVEVDHLQTAVEDMKTSLRSFRKYVPADLVARLLRSGQEAVLGGERRRLTIYFSDIANFTSISEAMEPERLVEHLGEYLQAMSGEVLTAGGTVDKYIGDAVMAFWGAPQELPTHALAACAAAIRNQQTLVRLREKWKTEGKPLFFARIGINTGEVVVGNIGSAARLNYTVIGDAVNLASRLEGLNKYYGTATLISETTYEEAKDGIVARPLDWVSVKGKKNGVLVYELLGMKGRTDVGVEEWAALFAAALTAYRRRSWDEAMQGFEAVLSRRPDDEPAKEMLRRCAAYRDAPPGPDWDGVHRMEEK